MKQKQPDSSPSDFSASKFDELMAGRWEPLYHSQSEADLALCVLLANRHGGDYSIIEAEFNKSALAARGKWQERPDYRKSTIERAIAAQTTIVEDESEAPPEGVPICPTEITDGDYVGDLLDC